MVAVVRERIDIATTDDLKQQVKNQLCHAGFEFLRHGKGSHDVCRNAKTGTTLPLQRKCRRVISQIEFRRKPGSEKVLTEAQPMPYRTNDDLPESVSRHLPPHAQDIYRAAFNHAFEAHVGDPRQEEAASRIAWAAVKRSYVKVRGKWLNKHDI